MPRSEKKGVLTSMTSETRNQKINVQINPEESRGKEIIKITIEIN